MLLSSRTLTYASAIRDAQVGRKAIAPKASALGLTGDMSAQTLEELHSIRIADGLTSIGRKLIVESSCAAPDDGPRSCLGYLYHAEYADSEEEPPVVRTQGSGRIRIEPKLILRFAHAPQIADGFDAFIDAINAIGLGAEVLQLPFIGSSWLFEDKVCANGFSDTLIVGELKTLSRSSKQHFSQLLDLSAFSLSRNKATGSVLVDYSVGRQTTLSSVESLYAMLARASTASAPIASGDLVALNAVCQPQRVSAGEEWVFVSTGFELASVRLRVAK